MITLNVVGDVIGPWSTQPQSDIEKLDRRLQRGPARIDTEMDQTFLEVSPADQPDYSEDPLRFTHAKPSL